MTTKIVAISDSHTQHSRLEIPECDILIHAGDFTYRGLFQEVSSFSNWLSKQPAKKKIIVAGNHELSFDPRQGRKYDPSARDIIANHYDDDVYYIENRNIILDDINYFGSPWTPEFFDWAFNGLRNEQAHLDNRIALSYLYGQMSKKTDIVICHGPPYGIVDKADDGRLGSRELLKVINDTPSVKLVICGHLHEARGHEVVNGVHYCNVSSLDRDYRTLKPPVIIHLDDNKNVLSVEGY